MKIFLNSTDTKLIRKLCKYEFIDGITTNCSLQDISKHTIAEICSIIDDRDLGISIINGSYDSMIAQGNELFDIAQNIILKIPITYAGISVCRHFAENNKKVNMVECVNANQALFAARSGAAYISPIVYNPQDSLYDGVELIRTIRNIYDNYGFDTEILATSIISENQVEKIASIGADSVVLSKDILDHIMNMKPTNKQKFDFHSSSSNEDIALHHRKISSSMN